MSTGKAHVLVLLLFGMTACEPAASPPKMPPASAGGSGGGGGRAGAGGGGTGGSGHSGTGGSAATAGSGPMTPPQAGSSGNGGGAVGTGGSLDGGGSGGTAGSAGAEDAAGGSTAPADGGAEAPPPLPAFPLEQVKAAKPELYAASGGHIEGVSWRDGEIFFSRIPQGFFKVDIARKVTRYADLASNGSLVLGDGSLLVCDDRNAVVQIFRDGKVGALGTAARCNDVTVDAWGNIYFSDFRDSITRITPEGQQSKFLTGLRQPNGLEVDPESKYLYFMPRPSDIYRVAISKDGPMGAPEKLGQLDGVTDGGAFDAYGNLWVTVYYGGKIGVFDPAKKQLLTYVAAGGSGLTNMAFGGPNRDEVFTTVDNKGIHRIPVGVRGFAGHPGAPKYTVKSYLPSATP